jgi:hypothetical protein
MIILILKTSFVKKKYSQEGRAGNCLKRFGDLALGMRVGI